MASIKQIASSSDQLTSIEDIAAAWGVSAKTVQNWCEFVYQAFEVILPSNGPFPEWATQLLTLTAKHISVKANLYFAETGEKRRLKGSEFVSKMRKMRAEGHFQEFQKFQKFQESPTLPSADELEDELLAEVGALTRQNDERVAKLKQAIEQREEQQVNELVTFVEDSDHRVLGKLTDRLKASKLLKSVEGEAPRIDDAIEVAYQKLPD